MPTCWWLLSNGPDTSHHGDHGSGHGASHHKEKEEEVESSEEESKEESKEEEPKAEEEDAKPEEDDKKSESSEDSDSEESKKDTPPSSDDEGGDDKVSESDEGDVTKKTYPDAKGGIKKRLESNKSIRQGADDSEEVVKDDKVSKATPQDNLSLTLDVTACIFPACRIPEQDQRKAGRFVEYRHQAFRRYSKQSREEHQRRGCTRVFQAERNC